MRCGRTAEHALGATSLPPPRSHGAVTGTRSQTPSEMHAWRTGSPAVSRSSFLPSLRAMACPVARRFQRWDMQARTLVSLDGIEEVASTLRLRVLEESIGCSLFENLPVGHEHHTVCHTAGKVHLVRDDHHGHALTR